MLSIVSVSAEHDGITLGEFPAEITPLLSMLLRCTAVEEPSDAVSVNREDRTVADYESVARPQYPSDTVL